MLGSLSEIYAGHLLYKFLKRTVTDVKFFAKQVGVVTLREDDAYS